MKKILNNDYLLLASRIFLGMFFIIAAIGKISDPNLFSKEIGNYQLMPYFSLNIFALVLPWIELVSGLLLIFGVKLKANSFIIGSLLVVFIVAVFSAMMRGLNINCGCFSNQVVIVGWQKILENIGLLVLSLIIYFSRPTKFINQNEYELNTK